MLLVVDGTEEVLVPLAAVFLHAPPRSSKSYVAHFIRKLDARSAVVAVAV